MTSEDSTTKICTQCPGEKALSEFGKQKNSKDGLRSCCNDCQKKSNSFYRRSKNGLIGRVYDAQKRRSVKRGHNSPEYNLKELRDWALSQSIFHNLYNAWVSSGYSTMLKPSFDRTDDYQGYCLSRLQIMTWRENLDKAHSDMRSGINNKQSKAVMQSTKSGVFVKRYYSAQQACRETSIRQNHISECCNAKRNTAGGFCWGFDMSEVE